MRRLTLKQKAAAKFYALGHDGAASVRKAGYNTKYPEKIAYLLKQNPRYMAEVDKQKERIEESLSRNNITYDRISAKLDEAMNSEYAGKPDWPTIMKAIKESKELLESIREKEPTKNLHLHAGPSFLEKLTHESQQ